MNELGLDVGFVGQQAVEDVDRLVNAAGLEPAAQGDVGVRNVVVPDATALYDGCIFCSGRPRRHLIDRQGLLAEESLPSLAPSRLDASAVSRARARLNPPNLATLALMPPENPSVRGASDACNAAAARCLKDQNHCARVCTWPKAR